MSVEVYVVKTGIANIGSIVAALHRVGAKTRFARTPSP